MAGKALQDLLTVQDLDLGADQLRHRRSHLPERGELAGVDADATALESDLRAVEEALREIDARQKATEAELASTEERAKTVNRRLFGGEVSASRDLQAMSVELDQLKARTSSLEDSVLELMEDREPLDGRAVALRAGREELAARRVELQARLQAAQADIDDQMGELTARRAEAASVVPAGLLSLYEQLRSRLGGVGVARLVGNRCDGCHLSLPAAELDRVRHLGDEEIYQCEQCQRILVP